MTIPTRILGKTGYAVSEISLGAWQLGGKWGDSFDPALANSVLRAALNAGVNFVDTADVYSNGESERAIGKFLRQNPGAFLVATKCGRRIQPHTAENYQIDTLRSHVEDSLRNLGVECLDLVQLHCPPSAVYARPEIFGLFEQLQKEGKIKYMGVSVEKIEEAEAALQYPNVATVQIIFNLFRQRPSEVFFAKARAANVGIIARVPLASGLLTGKFNAETRFSEGDHRLFNRNGEQFDKGETFSGVPYETGLAAVAALDGVFDSVPLAQAALRWILMFDVVSVAIPGASRPEQVGQNVAASALPPFTQDQMQATRAVYHELIAPFVHQAW